MIQIVLVCSDGSPSGLYAVETALEVAARFQATLCHLTIYNPALLQSVGAITPGAVISTETIAQQAEEKQEEMEREARDMLCERNISCQFLRRMGPPVETIAHAVEEMHADLLVIGRRGLEGLDRVLLGSVSQEVVHMAHCPVLVAHKPAPEKGNSHERAYRVSL